MTAAVAETLTGDAQAARTLADLHADNFFTDRRPGPESVYEYHPLFREFLIVRAVEALEPAALGELRRAAAALLEQSGRLEAAAELLIAAGWTFRRSSRVTPGDGRPGEVFTLRTWLTRPRDVADAP
jgi:ATP/maltotriose-dependent transcriptional regulator MalT